MPERVKGHSSHDIVLLCQKCHRTATIATESFRKILKKDDRLSVDDNDSWTIDANLREVRSAACALLKFGDKIPASRAEELRNTLKTHFKKDELTTEDLQEASNLEFKFKKEQENESHEERIIKNLNPEELVQFVQRWRKYFVDVMKPQHLPKGWSTDQPVILT
jgi:hypothetical protein